MITDKDNELAFKAHAGTPQWADGPSQITNLGTYLLMLALFGLAFYASSAWPAEWVADTLPFTGVTENHVAVVYSGLILAPLTWAFWCYLVVYFTRYTVTDQKILKRVGVLNVQIDYVELYRVKDYQLQKPLLLRIFGLGTVRVQTSDRSRPLFHLVGIRDSENVGMSIRTLSEAKRLERGVRELDVSSAG
ncbi:MULTISPECIES: PH domain-containing protein [unclassified Thioalkalivibrio]|uniref:PH domain-containing protein n=1 Tax=unclassified Thioalkalivibrio TaxID=2621013 RepID=UPI000381CBC6|nr:MULTISPECIES: PH domain-containing protein [unclassified Thioalkalivibrio]